MSRIDRALDSIDGGMEGNVIFMPGQVIRDIEDEVWAELEQGVEDGLMSFQEATDCFIGWQRQHRPCGPEKAATRPNTGLSNFDQLCAKLLHEGQITHDDYEAAMRSYVQHNFAGVIEQQIDVEPI